MQRRKFLMGGLSLLALATAKAKVDTAVVQSDPKRVLLSAATDRDGQHWLIGFNPDGRQRYRLALPTRGHALAVSNNHQTAVAVARRPGKYLIAFKPESGDIITSIKAPKNRHFYGHGVFSADNQWLYVTANAYSSQHRQTHGLVMVYDSRSLRLVDEWPSGGIGPHELLRIGDQLVIANGGIETHPDSGRTPLNLDTMHGSLVWMQAASGGITQQHQLPRRWRLSSPRHMGLIGPERERVAVVMQYEGNSRGQAPLIALADREIGLTVLNAPLRTQRRLKDYCGSVVADLSGEQFAVSSPRGNRLTIWSSDGEFLSEHKLDDVCGLAPTDRSGEWLASDGNGNLRLVSHDQGPHLLSGTSEFRWDNPISL